MSIQINLALIEENPTTVPDEIQRIGTEAIQILWQTSQEVAHQEINAIKNRYKKFEADVLHQRQVALDKVDHVNHDISVANGIIESLTREKKSLQVDLNRKIGDLKSAEDQIGILHQKLAQQEHEVRRLTEELGRSREQVDNLKKHLYEANRKVEQDKASIKETEEELIVTRHNRNRLEAELKMAKQEVHDVWQQLKGEQKRTAVAETLVKEVKETSRKYEAEIKVLKEEKKELQANMVSETKSRIEMEKKALMLTTRVEAQESGYKGIITRLEQELEVIKSEAATIRNRMIKAEAAYEREKNAFERLETKLIAVTGAKP
jgi:chromosome segregation ATPase